MKHLLTGAVLLGAATWFGRTTQERAWAELEQSQMIPDFIDRMSDSQFTTALCKRATEFIEEAEDLSEYVEAARYGRTKGSTSIIAPCAWDIRAKVMRSRDKLEELGRLTRHRRFTPDHFEDCSLALMEEAHSILQGSYGIGVGKKMADIYGPGEPIEKLLDKDTRSLFDAEKMIRDRCGVYKASQGAKWRKPPWWKPEDDLPMGAKAPPRHGPGFKLL